MQFSDSLGGERYLEYIGKNLSMIVYFIHIIVANYLEYFVDKVEGEEERQILSTFFPILVIICTIVISHFVFLLKKLFTKNSRFNPILCMVIIICFLIQLLPTGTELRLLYEYMGDDESHTAIMSEKFDKENQSVIIISAQNQNGTTVDAIEIPIEQFIGAGIARTSCFNNEYYSYRVNYIDSNIAEITMSDNLNKVRIWVR